MPFVTRPLVISFCRMLSLALLFVMLWGVTTARAQGTVTDNTTCDGNTLLGNFYGVKSCSNNPDKAPNRSTATGIDTGLEWQCVEYVDRFYFLYYGIQIHGPNANSWWTTTPTPGDLVHHVNDGPIPPRIGDVIVSSYTNPSTEALGHVAIVRRVTDTSVCTANQNWNQQISQIDGSLCSTLTKNPDGTFHVSPLNGSSHYVVDGWLRRPCTANASLSFSVQAHPEGTMVTADGLTIYLLYTPTLGNTLAKIPISNPDAFRNPYNQPYQDNQFGFDEVIFITPTELAQYPDTFILNSPRQLTSNSRANPDGKLITDGQTIAIVANGQKRQFTSLNDFFALGYKLCNVIRDDTYNSYPTGLNVVLPNSSGAPPAPTNPNPPNLATSIAFNPTFSWSAAAGATAYDVYIGPNIGPPSFAATVSTNSYTPPTSFDINQGIHWYVVAKNASGSTASPIWSFTTTGTCADHIDSVSQTAFSATGGTGTLAVRTPASCQRTLAASDTWISFTTGANEFGDGTVSFSVGQNPTNSPRSGSITATSQTFPITQTSSNCNSPCTPLPPDTPSPASGSTGISLNPTLSWSGGSSAPSYDVYLGTTSPSFLANVTGTSYAPATLNGNTTYKWFVAPRVSGAPASPIWQFTTAADTGLPNAPTNLVPSDGTTNLGLSPTLSWAPVTGADSYIVFFGVTNPPFAVTQTSNTFYSPGPLGSNTTYFWRVTAVNPSGRVSSPTIAFTTLTASSNGTVLVPGLSNPTSLVLDDTSIYWTEFGGLIRKVSKAGGAPQTIFASGLNPAGIAVDNTTVFYGDGQNVRSSPKNGGTSTILAASNPARITLDASNVYWTDFNAGAIKSVPKGGGTISTLATGSSSPVAITTDGTNVFWSEFSFPGTVKKVSVAGGTPTTLASNTNSEGIAIDGKNVYWPESLFIGNGKIDQVPINGGTATSVISGLDHPFDVATDGTSVFWTENNVTGAVRTVPIKGGTPITLATASQPTSVVVDNTSAYWIERDNGANGTGSLHKIAKPAIATTVNVTINTAPTNLDYEVDGKTFNGTQTFTFDQGSEHFVATNTQQSTANGVRFNWMNWSDGGDSAHSITASVDTTYALSFAPQYLLSTTATQGGAIAPGNAWYDPAAAVPVTAQAFAGFTFTGWQGACNGTSNCSVSMTAPQSIMATFTPVSPDYSISSNPNTATIHAGQSATFNITVNSIAQFNGTVTFACNNLPQFSACSFSPPSIALSSPSVATVLTLSTSGPHTASIAPFHDPRPTLASINWTILLLPVVLGLVSVFHAAVKKRRRFLFATFVLATLVACGGGGGSNPGSPTNNPITPAGTTNVTVTATGTGPNGAIIHQAVLNITVTQ